jgi:trehalose-phosphatase
MGNEPWAAQMPPGIAELLEELTSYHQVILAIISRRAVDDLEMRVPATILVGNNGLQVRGLSLDFEHPMAVRLRAELASVRDRVAQAISQWPSARIEDAGYIVTVHLHALAVAEQRAVTSAIRRSLTGLGTVLGLRSGKGCLDIHPRCGWSKGDALSFIRHELHAEENPCICIGKDRLDESIFLANQTGINIRVGWTDRTMAGYFVGDPIQLVPLLARLVRVLPHRTAIVEHAAALLDNGHPPAFWHQSPAG